MDRNKLKKVLQSGKKLQDQYIDTIIKEAYDYYLCGVRHWLEIAPGVEHFQEVLLDECRSDTNLTGDNETDYPYIKEKVLTVAIDDIVEWNLQNEYPVYLESLYEEKEKLLQEK